MLKSTRILMFLCLTWLGALASGCASYTMGGPTVHAAQAQRELADIAMRAGARDLARLHHERADGLERTARSWGFTELLLDTLLFGWLNAK